MANTYRMNCRWPNMLQQARRYSVGESDAKLTLTIWWKDLDGNAVSDALDYALSGMAWSKDLSWVCRTVAEYVKEELEKADFSESTAPIVIEAKAVNKAEYEKSEWLKSSRSIAKTTLLACMPKYGILSTPGEDIPLPSTD